MLFRVAINFRSIEQCSRGCELPVKVLPERQGFVEGTKRHGMEGLGWRERMCICMWIGRFCFDTSLVDGDQK